MSSFILVSEITENELESCLLDLVNMYDPQGLHELDLYRRKGATDYLVAVPEGCDFTLFAYCVNFIVYSRKPGLPRPWVDAYYAVAYDPSLPFLIGDVVRVYVASDDREFDNVTVVNDRNETFLFSFRNSKPRPQEHGERAFRLPPVTIDEYNHLITLMASPPPEVENKPWWKFWG